MMHFEKLLTGSRFFVLGCYMIYRKLKEFYGILKLFESDKVTFE